jgi:hypothetical protein
MFNIEGNKMKQKIIMLGVMTLLLTILVFSGCTDNKTDKTPDTSTPITPTYNDEEFMLWLYNTNDELGTYNTNELNALNNQYWYTLESYAEDEEDIIDDTFKPMCLSFDLSSSYDIIRDEYYEFLCDRSWSAFYMKWAAKYMQDNLYSSATDDFNEATNYINKATNHLNICINLIDGLN